MQRKGGARIFLFSLVDLLVVSLNSFQLPSTSLINRSSTALRSRSTSICLYFGNTATPIRSRCTGSGVLTKTATISAVRNMSGSTRSGRGEYYRNKYGGGRSSRGQGRGGRHHKPSSPQPPQGGGGGGGRGGTFADLQNLLESIDGRQYPSYHDLETSPPNTHYWLHPTGFKLQVGRAQSDPFAPPTRCRVQIPATLIQLPMSIAQQNCSSNNNIKIRRMAAADYLLRQLYQQCKSMGADQSLRSSSSGGGGRGSGSGWSGPKGGDIQILQPTQHVLEQSAVQVVAATAAAAVSNDNDDDATGSVIVQLTINLPARGRTVLGRAAFEILDRILSRLIASICPPMRSDEVLLAHVNSVEDQIWLQSQLVESNLIAFVRNGAILPRRSGVDDRPLDESVVPFASPPSLQRTFVLPNAGTTITGMGIPPGLTLICGGGFHGKSTLLQALQWAIFPKVPGDGREFCVVLPNGIKIRAEDGRSVQSVDISCFLNHLPFQKDTTCFSTMDASGSTSQASNIVEAIELGADMLLIDEDTCATNFMIRDHKMMELVAPDKEPITPFVRLVRSLYMERSISTILVMGGAGDYFDVADHVLLLDSYHCQDATTRAKEIVSNHGGPSVHSASFGIIRPRAVETRRLFPNGKVKVPRNGIISYGETEIDLTLVEQLVSASQTTAVAAVLQRLASMEMTFSSLRETLEAVNRAIDESGLDILAPEQYHGGFTRPRLLEMGTAINRLRRQGTVVQK